MRQKARCRKCGERIDFMPRPGFIRVGQSRYFAVNTDDRQPHSKRCAITLALKEERNRSRSQSATPVAKQKGSLTAKRAEALITTGVQLDAFDHP